MTKEQSSSSHSTNKDVKLEDVGMTRVKGEKLKKRKKEAQKGDLTTTKEKTRRKETLDLI